MAIQAIFRRNFLALWAVFVLTLAVTSVQAATFIVVVTPGPTPNPVRQNVAATQNFTASVSGVLASGQEVQIVDNSKVWSWNIAPTPDYPSDKVSYDASPTAAAGNPPTGWGTASISGGSLQSPSSATTLTVNISQPGYYHIPVVARVDFKYIDSSGNTQTDHASGKYVALIVVAAGDFTLSASPSSVKLPQGGNNGGTNNNGPSTITVSSINGMTGAVSLSISNNPNGTSAQINPDATANITTPNGSDTKHNVSVFVGKSVPVGNYALHVNGTWSPSSSLSIGYYTTLTVTVQKPSLFLDSSTIEPSISKSGANNRNADGSIIVDSIAIWNSDDKTWNTGSVQAGPMSITAHPTDYIDPTHAWTYSSPIYTWTNSGGTPSGTTQGYLGKANSSSRTFLPYSAVVGSEPVKGFPVTTTITGNVYDNVASENVDATNTYTVRWHQLYEPTGPLANSQRGNTKLRELVGPVDASVGHDKTWTVDEAAFEMPAYVEPSLDIAAKGAAIAGQEHVAAFLELAGAITKASELVLPAYKNSELATNNSDTWNSACRLQESENAYTDTWTDSNSTGFNGKPVSVTNHIPDGFLHVTNASTLPATMTFTDYHDFCYLYDFYVEHWKDYWYPGDVYNVHGYVSHAPYIKFHHVDGRDIEPFFAQYKTTSGH